jgi:3-hydroxybutyryl-CoA dehydratase
MTIHRYFDELKVGDTQLTRGRTITEADLVNFAGVTGDYFPLHTDAEYAKNSMFGERIAHGMLVLSDTIGLLDLQPGAIQAFYGIEELRFVKPVKIGDTIHAELEVLALESRGERRGLATNQLQVKNQRDELVISATLKWLLSKKPSSGSQ